MKTPMKIGHIILGLFCVMCLWMAGCATVPPPAKPTVGESLPIPEKPPRYAIDLSGTWEYEEGNVVTSLTLDQNGNGSYDWQGGTFLTTTVSHGRWKGIWRQMENDREGGFEAVLESNNASATGRWWYSRIGEDTDPPQPGGTFTLTRIPSKKSQAVKTSAP